MIAHLVSGLSLSVHIITPWSGQPTLLLRLIAQVPRIWNIVGDSEKNSNKRPHLTSQWNGSLEVPTHFRVTRSTGIKSCSENQHYLSSTPLWVLPVQPILMSSSFLYSTKFLSGLLASGLLVSGLLISPCSEQTHSALFSLAELCNRCTACLNGWSNGRWLIALMETHKCLPCTNCLMPFSPPVSTLWGSSVPFLISSGSKAKFSESLWLA